MKLCVYCNEEIKPSNKFCNSSCAANYNNKHRSQESREKQRASVKKTVDLKGDVASCIVCFKDFLRKNKDHLSCSRRCRLINLRNKKEENDFLEGRIDDCYICGEKKQIERKTCKKKSCINKHNSLRQTAYLKNPENRKKYKGNGSKSYMEETFESWLIEHGFENSRKGFLSQLHFFNKGSGKHGWIDFAFPRLKKIIELDGTHHRNRAELDTIRDEYLKAKGYEIMRITIQEYYGKKRIDDIKSFLGIA